MGGGGGSGGSPTTGGNNLSWLDADATRRDAMRRFPTPFHRLGRCTHQYPSLSVLLQGTANPRVVLKTLNCRHWPPEPLLPSVIIKVPHLAHLDLSGHRDVHGIGQVHVAQVCSAHSIGVRRWGHGSLVPGQTSRTREGGEETCDGAGGSKPPRGSGHHRGHQHFGSRTPRSLSLRSMPALQDLVLCFSAAAGENACENSSRDVTMRR